MSRAARIALILSMANAVACGSDDGAKETPDAGPQAAELYAACGDESPTMCASDNCGTFVGLGYCTDSCSKDADCAGPNGEKGSCRDVPVSTDGSLEKLCVLPCTESSMWSWECKDSVSLFCGVPDSGASCEVCGCDDGSYCDGASHACKPLIAGGDACGGDEACTSGKCVENVCTAGPGDACGESCDGVCNGDGANTYCAPRCTDTYFCSDLPGWDCIRTRELESEDRYCTPQCDSKADCPGSGEDCIPYEQPAGLPSDHVGICWVAP